MKRFWMIALVIGLVAGFGLATAFSAAYAQAGTPQTPQGIGPVGQGMHNGVGRMSQANGAMRGMGQPVAGQGMMHETMEAALAAQLGMTTEAYQTLWNEGQTFWQIAEAQGYSLEEAQQMMTDTRSTTLDSLVADGTLTQAQANMMTTRMGNGLRDGSCDGTMQRGGNQGGMRGMHGNWLTDQD